MPPSRTFAGSCNGARARQAAQELDLCASVIDTLANLKIRTERDVYFGWLKLNGEEDIYALRAAVNYAHTLVGLLRFEEARSLSRKTMPVARRALGEGHILTLKMAFHYSRALYEDPEATLDDLREAVATLEDTMRIARRVLGGAHPLIVEVEKAVRYARECSTAANLTQPSAHGVRN